jgi:hypothetical protein
MRHLRLLLIAALCLLPGGASGAGSVAPPAKLKSVTLHILSRVFPNFHDRVVAAPKREFRVGDSEYTAEVIRFEPDFTLDLNSHRITSRSGEPRNPAFQIVTRKSGVPHDTLWAFYNMPPHFGTKEVLAFIATRIDFTNRPTMESRDSLALQLERLSGAAH